MALVCALDRSGGDQLGGLVSKLRQYSNCSLQCTTVSYCGRTQPSPTIAFFPPATLASFRPTCSTRSLSITGSASAVRPRTSC